MNNLNASAIQMKAVSVMSKHNHMKAVSKMLTAGFKLEKTEVDGVFDVSMKDGNVKAVLVENRYLIVGYAKPKKAKDQVVYLNKKISLTSIDTDNVIVLDLVDKTVENGISIKGFELSEGSFAAKSYMTGLEVTTVRNYLNHTQIYFVKIDGVTHVAENIKMARSMINSKISTINLTSVGEDGEEIETVSVAFMPDEIPTQPSSVLA